GRARHSATRRGQSKPEARARAADSLARASGFLLACITSPRVVYRQPANRAYRLRPRSTTAQTKVITSSVYTSEYMLCSEARAFIKWEMSCPWVFTICLNDAAAERVHVPMSM